MPNRSYNQLLTASPERYRRAQREGEVRKALGGARVGEGAAGALSSSSSAPSLLPPVSSAARPSSSSRGTAGAGGFRRPSCRQEEVEPLTLGASAERVARLDVATGRSRRPSGVSDLGTQAAVSSMASDAGPPQRALPPRLKLQPIGAGAGPVVGPSAPLRLSVGQKLAGCSSVPDFHSEVSTQVGSLQSSARSMASMVPSLRLPSKEHAHSRMGVV